MRAAIALGSNLPSRFGDPAANLHEAIARLGTLGTVLAVSRFHQTAPVGYADQPWFTNAAVLLEIPLAPLPLLHALLRIEQQMDRVRAADAPPKGPRIIDLDILLYVDRAGHSLTLYSAELTLPHPQLARRAFVLEPLAEIAPGMTVPPSDETVAALWFRVHEMTAKQ